MPGQAIGLSLGFGYAGNYSRTPDMITEAKAVAVDSDPINFGDPAILNTDNTFSACSSVTLTTANFAGVAAARIKQFTTYPTTTDGLGGQYLAEEVCDVIQRGIVSVKVVHGTPTAGGAAFVRKTANGAFPDEPVGAFRADADGGNTVQLPNAVWNTGLIDANGICELKLKVANN